MTLQWLTSWWNLIFLVPFGLGLVYLGLYTVSGWTFGDADLDHDVSVDHALGVDHDLDVETDAGMDADTDSDSGSGSHTPAILSILNWIGLGRAPVSLVLMILMLSWGVIGFLAVQVERGRSVYELVATGVAVAGVGASLITHVVATFLGRTLFTHRYAPLGRNDLIGRLAEALYPIDGTFGMVAGRDARGDYFQVPCRVGDQQQTVAKGAVVKLTAYSPDDRFFYVVPEPEAAPPQPVGE